MALLVILLPFFLQVIFKQSLTTFPFNVTQSFGPVGTNWVVASGLTSLGPESIPPRFRIYRRCRRAEFISFLLVIGGVEKNPGPDQLRCGLLNVRYATNKAALIHDTIDCERLDLFFLVETNISHDAPAAIRDDIAPPGYKCVHAPRIGRKKVKGGGIAVVYRDNIQVNMMNFNRKDSFEGLYVKVISGRRRLNVAVLYRPPPRANIIFFNELSSLLDFMSSLPGDMLVCGDFNCADSGIIDTRLQDLIHDFGLTQHVNKPTRLINLLDLVISSGDQNIVTEPEVKCVGFSDHCIVLFDVKIPYTPVSSVTFKYRNFKNVDKVLFERDMRGSTVYTNPPLLVDDYVDQLNMDVLRCLDRVAPLKTKTKRTGGKVCAWVNEEVKRARRTRRALERRYLHTKLECDYIAYRRASRISVKTVNEARSQYYRKTIDELSDQPRKRWQIVGQLLHSSPAPSNLDLQSATSLAISFTNFFADKISKIRDTIQKSLAGTTLLLTLPPTSQPLVFNTLPPVTSGEVLQILKCPTASKSSPVDVVPSQLLKLCPDLFAFFISEIANRSFTQSTFPTSFKTAQITPLLKKPSLDSADPSNFRPISNLSTIGKLIEHLILDRIKPHIISSANFPVHQSAYRSHHSTETAMLRVTNDLLSAIGNGTPSFLATIDLTAAFDTVNHSTLITRLEEAFGICDSTLLLLKSYLRHRLQYVKVGSFAVPTTECLSGVPQGSVLGPLLFATYVAPVSSLVASFGICHHSYADDITLYVKLISSGKESRDMLLKCISAVQHWFLSNGLLINASKSELIDIGSATQLRTTAPESSYTVADEAITPSNKLKILGVVLDNRMSFDAHVAEVCRSCSFHTRALQHIRKHIDFHTAKAIACSTVGSRLDYCNSILAGISEYNLNRLQRIQNNVARVVCQVPRRSNASELLFNLHWLPVRQRIDYKIALLTFKSLTLNQPVYVSELLHVQQPARCLRSSNEHLLVVPGVNNKTVTASRAFQNYAPKLWNGLNKDLRNLALTCNFDMLNVFKSGLKTELFTSAFHEQLSR